MAEQIKIDGTYTYEYDDGHVRILRHVQPWLENPEGSKAWIAAANEIEELRRRVAELSRVEATADDEETVKVAIGYEPVLVSMPPDADGKHCGGLTYRTVSDRDYLVKVITPLLAAAREEGRQAGLAVGLEAADDVALAKHETEAWLNKYKAEIERLNRALQEAKEAYRRDICPAHRTR